MASKQGLVIMSSEPLAALGLKTLLVTHEPYLELMATTSGETDTSEALTVHRPELLVAFDPTPGQVARFRGLSPQTEVMAVLSGPAPVANLAKEIMGAGALVLVASDEPSASFQAGAIDALESTRYISSRLAVEMARDHTELTEREGQVVALTAAGYSSRQIAERLYLSVRTVESHRARSYKKLGCSERWQLVKYAIEHGMLTSGVWDEETGSGAGGDGPAAV